MYVSIYNIEHMGLSLKIIRQMDSNCSLVIFFYHKRICDKKKLNTRQIGFYTNNLRKISEKFFSF